MRDDDGGGAGRLEVRFEPLGRLDIEVVGRLVEQEQVWRADEQFGERDAGAPAAGEFAGPLVDVLLPEAEAGQDLVDLGLDAVAASGLEAGQHLGVAVDQAAKLVVGQGLAVPAGAVAAEPLLDLGGLVLQGQEIGVGGEHLVPEGALVDDAGILRQVPDGPAVGKLDSPGVQSSSEAR